MAQHYISIGPMYRVILCFWHRDRKRHLYNNAAVRKHCTITYAVSILAGVEDCGSKLKQHWVNVTCLRKIHRSPSDGLLLGQRLKRLTGIEPVMGCDAGPTFNWNLVGLHALYEVHRRQVLNECWPAPAMVVEGIHVEDNILICLLGFFINYILDI